MDSQHWIPTTALATLLACGLVMSGCKSNETKPAESTQPAQTTQKAESPPPQAAPAPTASQKPVCREEPKTTSRKSKSKTAKTTQPADCVPASQAAAAPAPEPVAQAPSASGTYNLSRNKPITDSSQAKAGEGTKVKGINDWEGEISGIPAAGSKFTKLKIGMSTDEVFRLIGMPTGQSNYPTGKTHIPFYHGADRWRQEAIYNGHGRLIFSQQGGWGASEYNLIWIIHSANEGR